MKAIRRILVAVVVFGALAVLWQYPPAGGWQKVLADAGHWLRMTINPDAANTPGANVGGDAAAPANDDANDHDNGLSADEEAGAPSRVVHANGLPAIRLTVQEQRQTGVQVQALTAASYRRELTAMGRVVDVQPLLALRNAYNAARADLALAQAALASSGPAVVRLRKLHGEDANVSTRQLQAAQAQAAADRAKVTAAQRRMQDVHDEAVQRWGTTLARWALSNDTGELDSLVSHRDCIVLVSLRPDQALPPDTRGIFIGPTGERKQARAADFVSNAPQTDTETQGQTFFFKAAAGDLRTGMRVQAWIPRGPILQGVEVPDSAVIWYAGRLWVYVQDADGLFVRHVLGAHHETHQGWFAAGGVHAGDKVVVAGAQMLFSEEFRTAIPSEDDR